MSEEKPLQIDATDRIRELNDIDKEVVALLHAAAQAIKSLAHGHQAPNSHPLQTSAAAADEAFAARNLEYLHTLQGVSARLRRQTYALEEARILAPDADNTEMQSSGSKHAAPTTEGTASNMGIFDIGWLNSRRDDVARTKEAELWKEAREFLDELNGRL